MLVLCKLMSCGQFSMNLMTTEFITCDVLKYFWSTDRLISKASMFVCPLQLHVSNSNIHKTELLPIFNYTPLKHHNSATYIIIEKSL